MKEVNKPFSEPDTIIGNVYASNSGMLVDYQYSLDIVIVVYLLN